MFGSAAVFEEFTTIHVQSMGFDSRVAGAAIFPRDGSSGRRDSAAGDDVGIGLRSSRAHGKVGVAAGLSVWNHVSGDRQLVPPRRAHERPPRTPTAISHVIAAGSECRSVVCVGPVLRHVGARQIHFTSTGNADQRPRHGHHVRGNSRHALYRGAVHLVMGNALSLHRSLRPRILLGCHLRRLVLACTRHRLDRHPVHLCHRCGLDGVANTPHIAGDCSRGISLAEVMTVIAQMFGPVFYPSETIQHLRPA